MENLNEVDMRYINTYGNIKHSYLIHVRRMKERGESYTTYAGFWIRVKKGWPLYLAIHTPAHKRKKKGRLYNIIYSTKNLFRKITNGRGRKRTSRH